MRKLTATLVALVVAVVTSVATASQADAAPGHTSCRALGQTAAAEAKAGVLVPEIQEFAPGEVDDLQRLAMTELCTPR